LSILKKGIYIGLREADSAYFYDLGFVA